MEGGKPMLDLQSRSLKLLPILGVSSLPVLLPTFLRVFAVASCAFRVGLNTVCGRAGFITSAGDTGDAADAEELVGEEYSTCCGLDVRWTSAWFGEASSVPFLSRKTALGLYSSSWTGFVKGKKAGASSTSFSGTRLLNDGRFPTLKRDGRRRGSGREGFRLANSVSESAEELLDSIAPEVLLLRPSFASRMACVRAFASSGFFEELCLAL